MMDVSVSRLSGVSRDDARGTCGGATTPTNLGTPRSQSSGRAARRHPRQGVGHTPASRDDNRGDISATSGTSETNNTDGAEGVHNAECSTVADYTSFAEATAAKRERVPERYQDFLLRLCESLRSSSADLAARLFPTLSEERRQRVLLALLAAECTGDVFVHDRVAVPHKVTWVVPFDGHVFAPADLQVHVFDSEDPVELHGRDYPIQAWGRRWIDRSEGLEGSVDSEGSA